MKLINIHELRRAPDGLLLDVRTPAEFDQMHAPEAILMPLSGLDGNAVSRLSRGRPVYLLCQSGNRAKLAAEKIEKAGFSNWSVVDGGMIAWEAAGLPVRRGRATISLERQVRIAAGTLVLAGVALGVLVHPGLFALSGLVGAGLVFAGITDTCGMGLLLARMPWNTRSLSSSGSCQPSAASHPGQVPPRQ